MRIPQPFRFLAVIYTLAMVLTACGEAATTPKPSATAVSNDVAAPKPSATAVSNDVAAILKSQLVADSVLVNTVALTAADPAVLTIDYQFNDSGVAHTQVDISTMINVETDRVVTDVSKRVVAQMDAGAKIDQVVLIRHFAKGDTAFIQRIDVRDMQAWSAGKLSDGAYRTRWCCNNSLDASTPQAYPVPGAQSSGGYPAPAVQSPGGYPASP